MLKLTSILCFVVLVFITNSNSQDRISKRTIPENFPIERFHETNQPNELWLFNLDENDPLLQKI